MRYGWVDFEPDEWDGVADKYILTIFSFTPAGEADEEVAVIVHRTCNGRYPLDGESANAKRSNAKMIVSALNAGVTG